MREKNDIVILDLEGEIRFGASSLSLHQLVKEQIEAQKKNILLNFGRVDFIDSYGIGDVLSAYISAQNRGAKLKISGLSDKLWLIFNYSGLTKIIEIFDHEEEALRSFH